MRTLIIAALLGSMVAAVVLWGPSVVRSSYLDDGNDEGREAPPPVNEAFRYRPGLGDTAGVRMVGNIALEPDPTSGTPGASMDFNVTYRVEVTQVSADRIAYEARVEDITLEVPSIVAEAPQAVQEAIRRVPEAMRGRTLQITMTPGGDHHETIVLPIESASPPDDPVRAQVHAAVEDGLFQLSQIMEFMTPPLAPQPVSAGDTWSAIVQLLTTEQAELELRLDEADGTRLQISAQKETEEIIAGRQSGEKGVLTLALTLTADVDTQGVVPHRVRVEMTSKRFLQRSGAGEESRVPAGGASADVELVRVPL